jgi:transposase
MAALPTPESQPTLGNAALPAPEHLPDDPVILKQMILELLATLQQERADRDSLRHRLDLLLKRLYGPRQERFDPNQLNLFGDTAGEDTSPGPDVAAAAEPEASPRQARPHGRRRLPTNLPRETRHYELPAAERICATCGQVRVEIGVAQSERLEFRPAALFVVEDVVHKYVCPCCGHGQQAAATATADQPATATHTAPAATPLATAAPLEPPPMATMAEPEATVVSTTPAARPADNDATVVSAPLTAPTSIIVSAPRPAPPIAKGLPGPGLLAHLIVSKFVDHLPLYRLERIYERQGYLIPRSTLCDWLAACARALAPLYACLVARVLQSRVIHTDDTPVQIQDPPPETAKEGRLWVYLGDADHPYNVFDFTPNRKRDGPQQFLANYQGYLQADAFSGYDRLYLPAPGEGTARIIEVACHAHARRKFHEARGSDAARSHQALAYYSQLYEIERRAKEFDDDQRRAARQDLAVPILEQFCAWLETQQRDVLPKSPMADAIGYALNQWTALVRYTEVGYLAIDNNVAEREMKRVAIGRKNWLFVGSVRGGHTAATLMSFTATCLRLKIEPWAYLQDVLTRLPTTPADELQNLLPDHWQAARVASTPPASP